jgi:hypothetical protein
MLSDLSRLDPISLLPKKSMVGPSLDTTKLHLKPPSSATPTIKFLCSYGGKIIPRFPDGKLRYHGGETRVLGVERSISFAGQSYCISLLISTISPFLFFLLIPSLAFTVSSVICV